MALPMLGFHRLELVVKIPCDRLLTGWADTFFEQLPVIVYPTSDFSKTHGPLFLLFFQLVQLSLYILQWPIRRDSIVFQFLQEFLLCPCFHFIGSVPVQQLCNLLFRL